MHESRHKGTFLCLLVDSHSLHFFLDVVIHPIFFLNVFRLSEDIYR